MFLVEFQVTNLQGGKGGLTNPLEGREGIHNFRTQRENNNSLIQNKTHRDCGENRTAD